MRVTRSICVTILVLASVNVSQAAEESRLQKLQQQAIKHKSLVLVAAGVCATAGLFFLLQRTSSQESDFLKILKRLRSQRLVDAQSYHDAAPLASIESRIVGDNDGAVGVDSGNIFGRPTKHYEQQLATQSDLNKLQQEMRASPLWGADALIDGESILPRNRPLSLRLRTL